MLSSASFSACTPLGLTYPHDPSFKISQNLYAFADGFNMYIAPALKDARDVSLNRNEAVILTDYISLADCIDQNKKSDGTVQFASTVLVPGIGYWSCDSVNVTITPDKTSDSNIFIFNFDTITNTVQVMFGDSSYLTYDETTGTFYFQTQTVVNINGLSPQIYNYIVDGNNIVLFTNQSFLSNQYTVAWNTVSSVLSAANNITDSGVLPSHSTFFLGEIPDTNNNNEYRYGQSNWVQYNSNLANLSVKRSVSAVPQNVLLTTPYKTLSGDQLLTNINGLKNHLTPDFENNIDANNNVKQRDYYALFTGSNQEIGYENIFLGYEGGTQGITFKKGKYTWFHYPNTATQIGVNDTTIAINGSIAGNTPYKSDKIFKKQANYKKYSNWGDSLPVYQQNGTWLCTWLSGSPDPDTVPMWVDRYINPTLTGSISSTDDLVDLLLTSNNGQFVATDNLSGIEIDGTIFVSKLFSSFQQAYIDVPSQLTFDPGVLYVYHHLGENDNQTIVGMLSGDTKSYFVSANQIESTIVPGNVQMLYISDWTQGTTKDKSSFSNDVDITNIPLIVGDDTLTHNTLTTLGSAYGTSRFPVNFAPYEGFTISFNVSSGDWSNLYGDQLLGNYFDGGVGLFVNNRILTPLFYMYEISQGRNLELNSDLYILQESKLSNISTTSAVEFIFKRDYDQEYFVIDSGKNILRYDSANILLSATSTSAVISGNIVDAQIDGIGNLYILSVGGVYKYNTDNGILEYEFLDGGATKLSIDLHNNVSVLPYGVIDYAVDSQNNIFTITSTNVYKNNLTAFAGTDIKKIYCDIHDSIWILHDNKISKLTNHPYVVSTTTLSTNGTMSMTFGYNLLGNGTKEEYIIILDETNGWLTKLDINNRVLVSCAISTLSGQFIIDNSMSFRLAKGDPSGYDYQRKYARVNQKAGGVNVKVFTNNVVTLRSRVFDLYADVSGLTSGWHNFLISFSTAKGNLKLYIDGELVDQSSSDINGAQYTYRASNYRNEVRLQVGISSAKNGTLADRIKQPYAYIFDGAFNEVRIYNKALSDEDARYVSRNAYIDIYDDMLWNMPVGTNQYLEEIERFFQHRLPGNKSQFFNIRIRGYQPTTDEVRQVFEDSIREVITKIVPAYTQLKDIVWIA